MSTVGSRGLASPWGNWVTLSHPHRQTWGRKDKRIINAEEHQKWDKSRRRRNAIHSVSVPHSIVWGLWVLYSRRSTQQQQQQHKGKGIRVLVSDIIYTMRRWEKRNNIIEIGPYSTAVVCVCMISDTSILPARWICVCERHGICCAVYLNCGGFWKCDKLRAPGISLGIVLTNWIRTILLPLSVFFFLFLIYVESLYCGAVVYWLSLFFLFLLQVPTRKRQSPSLVCVL